VKAEAHADEPLQHAQDILKVLASAADDEQRGELRQRLRLLVAGLVASIYVKPEKHLGRVYCLAQINFRSGLVKWVNCGPGTYGGGRGLRRRGVVLATMTGARKKPAR
jgi:hypothetical protein